MRGDRMKKRKPRRKPAAPALEWLCDLSGKTARITSIGSHALMVENHCGIREYTGDKITLSTRCGPAEILGSNLLLNEVRRDALVIRGSIHAVKLPCREADGHEA